MSGDASLATMLQRAGHVRTTPDPWPQPEQEGAELRAMRLDEPIPFHTGTQILSGQYNQPDRHVAAASMAGWAGIAAAAIANRFASLEWQVYRDDRDDVEIIDDHPLTHLLNNPNPVMDMQTLQWLWAAQWAQTGDVYIQVVTDGLRVPTQLWPSLTHLCYPIADAREIISGYRITSVQGSVDLEREEIVRVYRPNPLSLYTSIGMLGMVQDTFQGDQFRQEHVRRAWEDNATPSVVMTAEPGTNAPIGQDLDDLNAVWRDMHHRRNGRARGVPAWIPPGFKPYEMGQSSIEGSNVALGEQSRRMVLASYGVPESILGMSQDSSRNVAETNDFVFDSKTMQPIAEFFASAFTKQLAHQFDPLLKVRFKPFVSRDKEFDLAQEQSDLDRGVLVVNEVRELRDGLDDASWGELPRAAFGDAPYTGEESDTHDAGNFGFGAPPPSPPTDAIDADDAEPEDPKQPSADVPRSTEEHRIPQSAARSTASVYHQLYNPAAAYNRTLERERTHGPKYRNMQMKIFRAQAAVAVERLKKKMPAGSRSYARVVSVDDIFDPDEWRAMYERFAKSMRADIIGYESAGELKRIGKVAKVANKNMNLGLPEPVETLNFDERIQQKLRDLGATDVLVDAETQRRIDRALRAGDKAGEGLAALSKRVRKVIADPVRARKIARTEVLKASQLALNESMSQSGVVAKKKWYTQRDNAVRYSHEIDGQVTTIDGTFTLRSGNQAFAPYDPSLPPEDAINCRCSAEPYFDFLEE